MSEFASPGLFTAFAAGLISFLSPCVLPLVPAYLSYVAGQSLHKSVSDAPTDPRSRAAAALLGGCFILGFSAVFIALGASASVLGRILQQYRYEAGIVGGALVTVFGLLMLIGTGRIPFLQRGFHFHVEGVAGKPLSAFALGLAFAFGWSPCIGPILGAILTVAAVADSSHAGIRLLGAYSLGLGVPFFFSALFLHEMTGRWKRLRLAGRSLQTVAAVVMVVMGVAIMTGELTTFSYWLLDAFPALAKIG
ncbi:MAG: cytochrome c biogenesis CcdA family protein [Burkholderiales bacterium]